MARKKRPRSPEPPSPGVSREAWGRVHPELDLHGMTGEEARTRTERWLRDQQARNVRTVMVVTGRGLHSRGIPVVRNEVEDLLTALKGRLVSKWEAASQGGSFRVELRRPPPPERRPPRAFESAVLNDANPALRLRAAEALAELGVSPTPALLDAEIRRLLAEGADEG
ncbi:MAG TPA: Smr/MutS family protein [Longimicrobium sp.]|uniref:Smr/MutS family protein n=1 Tax=Longimicrobium sp. TaxID=2029185 RepID=UPI002EDB3F93